MRGSELPIYPLLTIPCSLGHAGPAHPRVTPPTPTLLFQQPPLSTSDPAPCIHALPQSVGLGHWQHTGAVKSSGGPYFICGIPQSSYISAPRASFVPIQATIVPTHSFDPPPVANISVLDITSCLSTHSLDNILHLVCFRCYHFLSNPPVYNAWVFLFSTSSAKWKSLLWASRLTAFFVLLGVFGVDERAITRAKTE
jgi:hypothetical protein